MTLRKYEVHDVDDNDKLLVSFDTMDEAAAFMTEVDEKWDTDYRHLEGHDIVLTTAGDGYWLWAASGQGWVDPDAC